MIESNENDDERDFLEHPLVVEFSIQNPGDFVSAIFSTFKKIMTLHLKQEIEAGRATSDDHAMLKQMEKGDKNDLIVATLSAIVGSVCDHKAAAADLLQQLLVSVMNDDDSDSSTFMLTQDNHEAFIAAVEKAEADGESEVEWDGAAIPLEIARSAADMAASVAKEAAAKNTVH